jgi:predicted nucleotidyltransferase
MDDFLKKGSKKAAAGSPFRGASYDFRGKNRNQVSPPPGAGALEEEVEPESFDTHDHLEPRLWSEDNELKPLVAKVLRKIAQNFIDDLPIEVNVEDIRLTGSLANYNWSNYSDVDLHIVVDFLEVDENIRLVKSFFDNVRARWNDTHHISVKGYDVEIYVENINEPHHAAGLYSLLNDEWIKKPKKYRNQIDFPTARRKADDFDFQINIVQNLIDAGEYKTALRNVERLKEKIRNMRRAGLESTQREFSVENIAFKILRRDGALDRLSDLKNSAYDAMMSVNGENT